MVAPFSHFIWLYVCLQVLMCTWLMYVSVEGSGCPAGVGYRWLWATRRVLGTEHWSSARAVIDPRRWAISPAPMLEENKTWKLFGDTQQECRYTRTCIYFWGEKAHNTEEYGWYHIPCRKREYVWVKWDAQCLAVQLWAIKFKRMLDRGGELQSNKPQTQNMPL